MIPNQTSTEEEILSIFHSHADHDTPLVMTKSYHGVILSQEIRTIAVDQHQAVFQALDSGCCAAIEGCVHLHCYFLTKPVKARVRDLSYRRGMFSLSDFSYIEGPWQERLHERVEPKQPTYVSLRYRKMGFRASMLDLSINGMGVLICKAENPELEFKANTSVCIDFQTSPEYRWLKLGGAIHYQKMLSRSIARLGIRLYPKLEQARLLERYIQSRQKEILDELAAASILAKYSSGVEYQYF